MTEQAIGPLRRRMIEDMSIRKFAAKTRRPSCLEFDPLGAASWPVARQNISLSRPSSPIRLGLLSASYPPNWRQS